MLNRRPRLQPCGSSPSFTRTARRAPRLSGALLQCLQAAQVRHVAQRQRHETASNRLVRCAGRPSSEISASRAGWPGAAARPPSGAPSGWLSGEPSYEIGADWRGLISLRTPASTSVRRSVASRSRRKP